MRLSETSTQNNSDYKKISDNVTGCQGTNETRNEPEFTRDEF